MKKAIVIMSVIVIIGCIISIGGAYAATSYAISASKIGYTDNSSIGADNVQAAIDGTCTKFSNQLTELKKSMYPVGSIYISTKLSSPTAVASAIGGTWEAFGNGKVLRSSSGESEQTGGSSTAVLTTANLPSHSHSYTPSGSNLYNPQDLTTGDNSSNPSVTFSTGGKAFVINSTTVGGGLTKEAGFMTATTGWWQGISKNTSNISVSGSHTHTVTSENLQKAIGTITFSGKEAKTTECVNCSADSFSVIDPYITVYMYKRIS